jgi:hypothetical protein
LPTEHRSLKAAAALLGYIPWAGTTWFIVIVLQWVLFFPLAHRIYQRWGSAHSLWLAALSSSFCVLRVWDIVDAGTWLLGSDVPQPAWYYPWIFAPRVAWPVVAGMFLAKTRLHTNRVVVGASLLLMLLEPAFIRMVGVAPEAPFTGNLREQLITQFLDVPLAIVILGFFQIVRLPSAIASLLERAGATSWGLYLGHTLLFELVHLSGRAPEEENVALRALYALALLGTGAITTWAGGRVKRAIRRVRFQTRRVGLVGPR